MALTIGAGHKVAAAAALVLLAAGVVVWGLVATDFDMSVETAVREIRAWGMWGVAGSIGLMVAHSFLPFPAEIIACANGIVYGAFWGAMITWIGAMLGASRRSPWCDGWGGRSSSAWCLRSSGRS